MSVAMSEGGGVGVGVGVGEGDHRKGKGVVHAPEIPAGFLELLRDFTREVLRTQPLNIYSFGAKYFRRKLSEALGPGGVSSECSANQQVDDSVDSLWPRIHKACAEEDPNGARVLKWSQMSTALKATELGLSNIQIAVALSSCGDDQVIQYEDCQALLCKAVSACLSANKAASPDQDSEERRLPWKGLAPSQIEADLEEFLGKSKTNTGEPSQCQMSDLKKALLESNILGLRARDVNAIIFTIEASEDGMVDMETALNHVIDVLSTISQVGTEPGYSRSSQMLEAYLSKMLIRADEDEKGKLEFPHYIQVLGESSLKELGLSTVEILASVVSRSGGSGGVTKPVDYLSIVPVLVKQVLVTRSQPASKTSLEDCVGMKDTVLLGVINTAIQCLELEDAESISQEQFLSIFDNLRAESALLTNMHRDIFELAYWTITRKYDGAFKIEPGFRLLKNLIQYVHRASQGKGSVGKY